MTTLSSLVWRVNLTTQALTREPVPPAWARLGGRGLGAQILNDEVPAAGDPLGPAAKLVVAPGLLTGLGLSSCDRVSFCFKSPLTGGIKESNAGGTTGLKLARLGIQALIVEGQPARDSWWVLHLSAQGGRIEPAGDLAGLNVYKCGRRLRARYGARVAIAVIGRAGELGLSGAGIQNLDKDGVPSRIAARGGGGAVMGAMRLKAIILDDAGGAAPLVADPAAYKAAARRYTQALLAQPQTRIYRDFGTSANVHLVSTLGALPTRNFSAGQFEGSDQISGERLRELILQRGGQGRTSHACMPGCTICSSNIFPGPDGQAAVSPLEYETIGLTGSNLGIADLDAIAALNYQLNDLGLDSIEIGAALGVAAEAGLMAFGDSRRALELVDEIGRGTPLGRILGHGAALTGKILGIERVPAVKGQALSAYDPRAIKGTGVTYATSPQGADHTAGLTLRAKVNHLDPVGQAALSRTVQINMAGYDTLGACIFAGFGFAAATGVISELLAARYAEDFGAEPLPSLGRITLKLERAFNAAAGFTRAHDRLPAWLCHEALLPTGAVFDVSDEDLDGVFNW